MIAEKPSNRPELCSHRAITQLSGLGKIVNEITRLWRRHHLSYDQPNMWSSKPGVTWPCSRPVSADAPLSDWPRPKSSGSLLVQLILANYEKFDNYYKSLLPLKRVFVPEVSSADE